MPRLAVIVLAWNGRDVVPACLASLRTQTGSDDAVIVVDNASTDGTADLVAAEPPRVRLLRNGENLGYAGGMNTGLRIALDEGFEFAMVLNQDTVVEPGAIGALLAAAARTPDAAAFQPLLLRPDGSIDSAGIEVHRCPGASDALAGRPAADAPRDDAEIFGACGAAALFRASALRRSGLFDEEHFLIFEDVDLAFRLRLCGLGARLVPSAVVVHGRGISGSASSSPLRSFLVARNSLAIAIRYWPCGALLAHAPSLALRFLAALRHRAAAGRPLLPMLRRARRDRRRCRDRAKVAGTDRLLR